MNHRQSSCPSCGKTTIVEVSRYNGIKMFSCYNDSCDNYAALMVDMSDGDDLNLIRFDTMLDEMKNVMGDISNEEHF